MAGYIMSLFFSACAEYIVFANEMVLVNSFVVVAAANICAASGLDFGFSVFADFLASLSRSGDGCSRRLF